MYGDKTQSERLDTKGPKGQTIPKAKINLSYYITEEQFKNLYYTEKLTYVDIAKVIGYPYDLSAFSRTVRKLGWKNTVGKADKFTSNNDLFKRFDRESAWLYGWIITDGYVHDKYVDLTLQTKDTDVLLKFKNIAKFSGDIYIQDGHNVLRIYNRNIVSNLREQGIPKENKTFDCTFPNIPNELKWDLMRGAFEGDGCIKGKEKGGVDVSICGASKSFMTSISEFLADQGVDNYIREPRPGFYVVKAKGMASALRWMYFMYANTTDAIRMQRKFDYYVAVIREFYNHKRYVPEAIKLVELARQTIPECHEEYNAISTQKAVV